MLPEDAALETLVNAVAEKFGEVSSYGRPIVPAAPPRFSPYHEAAAVLATFEIETLRPTRADWQSPEAEARALDALRVDSKLVTDTQRRERLTLSTDVRREVLRSLGDRVNIDRALAVNRDPGPSADPVQEMFEAYVRGTSPPLTEQSARELTGTTQVVDWLEGLDLVPALPTRVEVQRRQQYVALLQPFADLATDFVGRGAELAIVREYIGVQPPGSVREQLLRVAASILSLREKPPLIIRGHGGSGKSTLVSRVILEHATLPNTEQFPWAYLDFDRTVLLAEEPLTLLIEAVRQLGIQYPHAAEFCERLRREWLAELGDRPTEIKRAMGRDIQAGDSARLVSSLNPVGQERYLRDFGALLRNLKVETDPFLLVLDTFERIQYRSSVVERGVCAFLERFQMHVPRLRTIIAGRAPLTNTSFPTKELPLGDFDEAASVALLVSKGVPDAAIARRLYAQVGGNPLSLRLAAELFKQEDFTRGGLTTRRLLFFRLEDNQVQAQLFARVLNHIRDPDVRKLVYPGLVLRRVTAEIIQLVLAKPSGVDVPDVATAQRLFDEMSREVGLVSVHGHAIVHRPDARRLVMPMVREREPLRVRQIEEAAVAYYTSREGVSDPDERLIERAEEIYHRLSLQQPLDEVGSRWLSGVERHLHGAVDELAARERAWLASRIGRTLTDAERRAADLEAWERDTVRRVRDLIQQRHLDDALDVLRQRDERRPGSPLYALEAELCEALEHWDDMRAIVERGIRSADDAGQRHEAITLRIWGARVDMRTRALYEARQKLDEAASLLHDAMTVPAVDTMLHRLALLRAEHADGKDPGGLVVAAPIKQQLVDRSRRMEDAEIRQEPSLMAWVAIEVGMDDQRVLQRVAGLIGLPTRSRSRVRLLAQALAAVDTAQPIPGSLADRAGAPQAASLTERWGQLMLSATPQALGVLIATLPLDVHRNVAITSSVIALLRETARARLVPGDVLWLEEEQQQVTETDSPPNETRARRPTPEPMDRPSPSARLRLTRQQTEDLNNALLSAFPTREALGRMLFFRLDRRLDAIAPFSDVRQVVLNLIQLASVEGWAADLVAAAREDNPGNPELQEFAAQFGLAAELADSPDLERLIKQPFFDVNRWRERLGIIEGQVCRVEIEGRSHGTGFLVGPDLVLTAFHVLEEIINGKWPPDLAGCRFDHKQLNDSGTVHEGTLYEFARPNWLVDFSPSASYEDLVNPDSRRSLGPNELTYALVRLARPAGADPVGGHRAAPNAASRRWIRIAPGATPLRGGPVLIVQHPEGSPLKVAFDSNGVIAIDNGGTRIFYRVNTAPGSSGSPCFDSDWQLLAMHVASDRRANVKVGISINAILNRLFEVGVGHLLNQVLP
jgi:hypothetical protein